MALTKFGNGVAEMRGSTAGNTYTRTKAGAITRQRVKPTNPRTSYQTDQRSIVTELSNAWSQTLTQSQRDAWTAYGLEFPSVNKLGEAVILSGIQAFMAVGSRLLAAGESYLADAPASQDVSELQTLSLAIDVGLGDSYELTWTATGTLTDDVLVVRSTPSISPGISSIQNRLRRLGETAADPTSPSDVKTLYTDRFGAAVEGKKVVMWCQFLRTTNGAMSSPLQASAIVAAT